MAKKTKTSNAKKFAVAAARLAHDNHCKDVLILDLRGLSPATDYFVIATGTSDRQIRTVADELDEISEKYDYRLFGRAGYEQAKWVLLDFIDVVVHVFDDEFREYYDLELLWGDAEKIKWEKSRRK